MIFVLWCLKTVWTGAKYCSSDIDHSMSFSCRPQAPFVAIVDKLFAYTERTGSGYPGACSFEEMINAIEWVFD